MGVCWRRRRYKIQKQIYRYALELLGKREYSDVALQKKLLFRFPKDKEAIAQVMLALKNEGVLNNQRYTDFYVHRRASRGIGPLRIVQELGTLKTRREEIDDSAERLGLDWNVLANEVAVKRLRGGACKTLQEQLKLKSFLRYRGFTLEQIRHAIHWSHEHD